MYAIIVIDIYVVLHLFVYFVVNGTKTIEFGVYLLFYPIPRALVVCFTSTLLSLIFPRK